MEHYYPPIDEFMCPCPYHMDPVLFLFSMDLYSGKVYLRFLQQMTGKLSIMFYVLIIETYGYDISLAYANDDMLGFDISISILA